MTELLLHFAGRSDHVERSIKPSLANHEWVICDRFVDSSFAYQGYGHGLDLEVIKHMHQLVIDGFQPDITLIFDMDVKEALVRASGRHDIENRYERMQIDFHERLRQGFLEIAKENSERCVVIDAAQPLEKVHYQVMEAVNHKFCLNISPLNEALMYDF